jgi:OmpA-OmpF porin, OOP family
MNLASMKYLSFLLVTLFAFAQQTDDPFTHINSPFDEQNPVISPDGEFLFLTIANHPQNVGGRRDPGDIWISKKEDAGWSVPVHGGVTLNNSAYNAVAGFSADGNELFLLSHYKSNGAAPTTQGIAVAKKAGGGWQVPVNITIPYFLNRSAALTGYYDETHEVLLVAAESYSTTGAEDIYVSMKQDGRWTELINIGQPVNTPFQEISPFLSGDGRRMYFASNGRSGFGSFDIYETTRLDDSWTNWSEPVNLGPQVNTEGRELFFRNTVAGYSIYTSTQNSDGYGDVRLYRDSIQAPSAVIKKPETFAATGNIIIRGKITNNKTGESVAARMQFRSDSAYATVSSSEGNYLLHIAPAKIYFIEVEAPGYVSLSEKLDVRGITMNNLEMNFKLQPIEVGTTVNLKSVLFEIGTTNLLEESYEELNVVVDFLKANPKVEIELEGHTDNRGDAKKNVALSQQRVDKVKAYLVSRGISAKRIRGKGYGGARPIATNDSEEARKLNRRVEFRILKN